MKVLVENPAVHSLNFLYLLLLELAGDFTLVYEKLGDRLKEFFETSPKRASFSYCMLVVIFL